MNLVALPFNSKWTATPLRAKMQHEALGYTCLNPSWIHQNHETLRWHCWACIFRIFRILLCYIAIWLDFWPLIWLRNFILTEPPSREIRRVWVATMTLVPTLGFAFLYVCASHPVHHAQQAMTVDAEGDVTEAKMKQLLLGLKRNFPFCVGWCKGRLLHCEGCTFIWMLKNKQHNFRTNLHLWIPFGDLVFCSCLFSSFVGDGWGLCLCQQNSHHHHMCPSPWGMWWKSSKHSS